MYIVWIEQSCNMIVHLCEACIDTDIDLNYVSSDFMKPAHKW